MPEPRSIDIHAGDPAEVIASSMTVAFDAVVQAIAALDLRPTSIDVHRQLGLTAVAVYFPSNDPAAVDALGARFDLPEADVLAGGHVFYERSGLAELGTSTGSLTVRTVRPGAQLPDPRAAASVATDTPKVITGELAVVPPALTTGSAA